MESGDDFLVMADAGKSEEAAFSVFQPFLGWLVASDLECPYLFWYIPEILCFIDINVTGFVANRFYFITSIYICILIISEF